MDDKELQSEETWDLVNAEQHEPVKNRRSVVSVAFRPEQFAEVTRRARATGMKLSEYIRSCSLMDPSEDMQAAGIMITTDLGASSIFRAESFSAVTTKISPEREELEEPIGSAEVPAQR